MHTSVPPTLQSRLQNISITPESPRVRLPNHSNQTKKLKFYKYSHLFPIFSLYTLAWRTCPLLLLQLTTTQGWLPSLGLTEHWIFLLFSCSHLLKAAASNFTPIFKTDSYTSHLSFAYRHFSGSNAQSPRILFKMLSFFSASLINFNASSSSFSHSSAQIQPSKWAHIPPLWQ